MFSSRSTRASIRWRSSAIRHKVAYGSMSSATSGSMSSVGTTYWPSSRKRAAHSRSRQASISSASWYRKSSTSLRRTSATGSHACRLADLRHVRFPPAPEGPQLVFVCVIGHVGFVFCRRALRDVEPLHRIRGERALRAVQSLDVVRRREAGRSEERQVVAQPQGPQPGVLVLRRQAPGTDDDLAGRDWLPGPDDDRRVVVDHQVREDDEIAVHVGHQPGPLGTEPLVERTALILQQRPDLLRPVGRPPRDRPSPAAEELRRRMAVAEVGPTAQAARTGVHSLIAQVLQVGGVRGRDVIAVVAVHRDHLPVAMGHVLVASGHDDHLVGLVGNKVDVLGGRPEIVDQALGLQARAHEDEPPVDVDPGRGEPMTADCELTLVARVTGDANQRAAGVVGPAMEEALERFRVATQDAADPRALMSAGVIENPNLVVGAPDHDHEMAAHRPGHEVAPPGNLRLVTDIEPRLIEYEPKLGVEDLLIAKDL